MACNDFTELMIGIKLGMGYGFSGFAFIGMGLKRAAIMECIIMYVYDLYGLRGVVIPNNEQHETGGDAETQFIRKGERKDLRKGIACTDTNGVYGFIHHERMLRTQTYPHFWGLLAPH